MEEVELRHNFKNRQEWRMALNEAPKDSWILKRSLGGGKSSSYVPIPIQQALADIFFDEFDVIDCRVEQIENEVVCTVKIQVLPSYPHSEHRIISGTGAKPITMSSGSKAQDFPKGKLTNSLEYCVPNARSSAISNALDTFANIFGRNLGRAVSAGFNMGEKKKKKK